VALALVGAGLLGAAVLPPWPGLVALCFAAFGFLGAQPVFWTIPPTLVAGVQLAGTIPLISGIGNLGGFVGPYVMGVAEDATGRSAAGLYLVAALVVLGLAAAATFRWVGAPRDRADHRVPALEG
jgi:nitrate/nitrite transporter NarK